MYTNTITNRKPKQIAACIELTPNDKAAVGKSDEENEKTQLKDSQEKKQRKFRLGKGS